MVLLRITPPPTLKSKAHLLAFADDVTSYADSSNTPNGISVSYTGLSLFQRNMTRSSKRD